MKPGFPTYFLLIITALCGSSCFSQDQWTLRHNELPFKDDITTTYKTKAEALSAAQNIYGRLLAEGYLDTKIDTSITDSTLNMDVQIGKPYFIRNILWLRDTSNTPLSYSENYRRPKPFDLSILGGNAEKTISQYENRGYPFVSVQLAALNMHDHDADVTFLLSEGPRVVMDSLIIKSTGKIPQRYIKNYLDVRKGDLYDEEKIRGEERKLREIPFVQSRQSPEIRFKPGEADLYLFLEKKKANYFNGVLGIRPDDKTGKVNITGDIEAKLLNAFNSGEELYLNFRKLQALTQDLNIRTTLPYLFNTPVGLDGELKIYKRDSTFTSVKTALGLVFAFSGQNQVKVFVEKNSTNQLTTYATAQPLANVNSTLYGLSTRLEKLDYRLNPRRGYSLTAQGATGNRNVGGNNLVAEGSTAPQVKKNVYRVEGILDYYLPTFKRQCIRIGALGSALFAPSIFDNEMYRLGGLRTLRGIDEESIYSTSYTVGSFEYRFLFEENSALYVFVDQGWYEKKGVTSFLTDTPIGFGAGVNFETKAGIFTFNYALGQQFDNPILVRNAKISFGFRNVF